MEILAYRKKKTKWTVQFDEMGQLQTGMQYGWSGNKEHELTAIPIFRAKLKYKGWHQGTRTMIIDFMGCEEDSLIRVLQGVGPCTYDMSMEDGMKIMEALIHEDDPAYEYHGDGWFTGVFSFAKRGNRVFIEPFKGDITKERTVADVESQVS